MKLTLTTILFVMLTSCVSKKQVEIIPLHPYFKYSSMLGKETKQVYFLVKNWNFSNKSNYGILNAFSEKYKLVDTSRYEFYSINFFLNSNFTNEGYKESESDLIEWHSKDLLFSKGWEKNEVRFIQRYVNGQLIDNGDTKIIDIESK